MMAPSSPTTITAQISRVGPPHPSHWVPPSQISWEAYASPATSPRWFLLGLLTKVKFSWCTLHFWELPDAYMLSFPFPLNGPFLVVLDHLWVRIEVISLVEADMVVRYTTRRNETAMCQLNYNLTPILTSLMKLSFISSLTDYTSFSCYIFR